MSIYWLIFASLSVAGSLAYNVGMKSSSPNANAFGFAVILSSCILIIEIICCVIAKYGFKIDVTQGLNLNTAKFALLAGSGAALIDISYFFALRYGSVMASQIFWTVGGLIALAIFAALFFREPITLTKAAGICLGIVSVLLMTRQS